MDEKQFDTLIRGALSEKAKRLTAPSGLRDRIGTEIRKQSKERWTMKKGKIRKICIIAAAFCILGAAAAIAAGRTTSLMVSSPGKAHPTYREYSQVAEASGTLGYEPKYVEQFIKNYRFSQGYLSEVEGMDEERNKTVAYKELNINYLDDGGHRLSFSAGRTPEEVKSMNTTVYDETKDTAGVTMKYCMDEYRFLPADAEPSEEDKKAEERGELFISYGSKEVETKFVQSVVWVQDGTDYLLMSMENTLSSEEMFSMAEQVILSE